MARPYWSSALRIVWFVLIGVGTSFSDRLIHPELSAMTQANDIGSSWQSNQSSQPCHCCTKECHFQLGNLTCHQVLMFPADYLSACSSRIVNINIVQGQFKTMNDSGLVHAKFPALERISIRNSSLQELDSLPVPGELIEVNVYNNANLSDIDWMIFFKAKKLQILNLANNQLERLVGSVMEMTSPRLSSLDLSGNSY